MAEPTFYVFDGSNLVHAGELGSREELIDQLASFVATRGVSGVVVFDGVGDERTIGRLSVRYAAHADDLIERLAAERRTEERVAVVSSDRAIEHATGKLVQHDAAASFIAELAAERPPPPDVSARLRVEDALDEDTRARLERLRRQR
ncbi:MAG: NYN domain-containing protein [Gaiellaceae bacterium]